MIPDIIIIPVSVFLAYKDKVPVKILTKYEELYKKYACFSTTITYMPSKFAHTETKAISRITHKGKDVKTVMRGILNVLNRSNYQKMCTKIRLLKNEQNLNYIIKEIIRMSISQLFYLEFFIKLLNDILDFSTDTEKRLINQVINDFIATVLTEKKWLFETSISEYEAFCGYIKHKNTIIAQHMLILELAKIPNIHFDLGKYISMLVMDLEECLKYEDEGRSILILQMLIHIAKSTKKISLQIDTNELLTQVTSKKIQFSIEELSNYTN